VRIIPAWGDAFPDATSQQTVVYGLPESESLSLLLITLNRHFFPSIYLIAFKIHLVFGICNTLWQ